MSKSNANQVLVFDKRSNEHAKGNKYAAIPYDEKLIRDELKSNIYKAIRVLNMNKQDTEEYLARKDCTVLEVLFCDAVKAKQWSVIERFFDRVIGTPAIKQVENDVGEAQKMNLKNLNDDELRTLRDLHRKVAGS